MDPPRAHRTPPTALVTRALRRLVVDVRLVDEPSRRQAERTMQVVRAACLVLAVGLSLSLVGPRPDPLWFGSGMIGLTLVVTELGLRRSRRDRWLPIYGALSWCGDALAAAITLDVVATDPADPIVNVTILLALAAAVRWGLLGGLLGGLVSGGIAANWLAGAHQAAGLDPPGEYLVFALASTTLIGAMAGRIVDQLHRSNRRAQAVQALSPELIVSIDGDHRVLSVNPAVTDVLGHDAAALVGSHCTVLLPPDERDTDPLEDALERSRHGELIERPLWSAYGRVVWVEVSLRRDPVDGVIHLVGRDVTQRRRAARERSITEQRFRALFERNLDAVLGLDADGCIREANPAAAGLLQADEVVGASILGFVDDLDRPSLREALQLALEGQAIDLEIATVVADASLQHVEMTLLPIVVDGATSGVFVLARDVTARLRREAELDFRASHDALTGLPNRATLHEHLAERLSTEATTAVLFIDLDGFKSVNDDHGHAAGDAVLMAAARRLTSVVRSRDLVCRLAGDEFCVLIAPADEVVVDRIATRAAQVLTEPVTVQGVNVRIGASVGHAIGQRGDDPRQLLDRADTAMYAVKSRHRLAPPRQERRRLPDPA